MPKGTFVSSESSDDDSSDDLVDSSFQHLMLQNYDESIEVNRKTNEAVIEKKSKKRQLKKDSDFASPKKVQPDNKVIYDKYIVYDKKRFDEKQELQRLLEIVDDARDLVWLNLKSYLALGHRDIWWPGRLLTQSEVYMLDTASYDHRRLNCKEYVFAEAFGYRKGLDYYPILILQRSIEPIYVRGISSELFQALTDVNNGAPTTVLYSQLKRGVVILEELTAKKHLDVCSPPLSAFDMKEDDCAIEAPKETSVCIDDNYRAKLKANTVNMAKQEKVEELRAGDFIGYYYKPYGPAGDKKAYFETHVLAIHRQAGELRLVLENGHVLVEDTQVKRLKDHKQVPLGSKSCFKSLSEYKLIEGSIAEEAARYGIYSKNELKNDLVDIMKSYNAKVTAMKGNSATFSSDLESTDSES
ncbi:hypothetical protein WA577_004661, partial [Blastocystis sp. JDR]